MATLLWSEDITSGTRMNQSNRLVANALRRCRKPSLTVPWRLYSSTSSSPPLHLQTIFAPATSAGRSGISILRISGPDALQVWHRMTRDRRKKTLVSAHKSSRRDANLLELNRPREPEPRKAILRRVVNPFTEEVLDEAIVIFFPGEFPLSSRSVLWS